MNRNKFPCKNLLLLFLLFSFVLFNVMYFSNATDDAEGFTSSIRNLYNPRIRAMRLYCNDTIKSSNKYIKNMYKRISRL